METHYTVQQILVCKGTPVYSELDKPFGPAMTDFIEVEVPRNKEQNAKHSKVHWDAQKRGESIFFSSESLEHCQGRGSEVSEQSADKAALSAR